MTASQYRKMQYHCGSATFALENVYNYKSVGAVSFLTNFPDKRRVHDKDIQRMANRLAQEPKLS